MGEKKYNFGKNLKVIIEPKDVLFSVGWNGNPPGEIPLSPVEENSVNSAEKENSSINIKQCYDFANNLNQESYIDNPVTPVSLFPDNSICSTNINSYAEFKLLYDRAFQKIK